MAGMGSEAVESIARQFGIVSPDESEPVTERPMLVAGSRALSYFPLDLCPR